MEDIRTCSTCQVFNLGITPHDRNIANQVAWLHQIDAADIAACDVGSEYTGRGIVGETEVIRTPISVNRSRDATAIFKDEVIGISAALQATDTRETGKAGRI